MRLLGMMALTILCVSILPAQQARIRDSAGVRIVENGSRNSAKTAFTQVRPAILTLGGLKSNPADELRHKSGNLLAARFSDGGAVISDEVRVRFYDSRGAQTAVFGREGQGPGEFTIAYGMCVTRGDTVLVGDSRNARVTVLDRNGKLVREIPVRKLGYVLPSSCFDDGTFVLTSRSGYKDTEQFSTLLHYNTSGKLIDSLGNIFTFSANPFLPQEGKIVATGQRYFLSDPRNREVQGFNMQGKLLTSIRTSDPAEKVTSAESGAMRPLVSGFGNARPMDDNKPKEWPSYKQLLADRDGTLWVQEYPKTKDDPNEWTAFAPDGRLLGKVVITASDKRTLQGVMAFDRGVVQTRERDEDGAAYFVFYRIAPVK